MIVVERSSARYEELESGGTSEDHLLERISTLENRLSRLTEKVERGLDLLLRQAQNAHFDRALVNALVGLLTEEGTIAGDKLERLWLDRCQKDAEEQLESERRDELRLQILASYRGKESGAFEQCINEGFLLIDDDQPGRGVRFLQRASEMSADNAPLLYFVGEYFFRTGKTRRAQNYLARAYELSPRDRRVSLLLGLTCADEGDVDRAKELLNSATRLGGSTFAAHYGLGRLFVAKAQWREALQEFKLALASKASPEAHYALGCLYYQLSRDGLATRHLRKALELDEHYGEAFYMLGLVSVRAGHLKLADEYFQKAGARAVAGKASAAKGRQQNSRQSLSAPLFRVSAANARKLISGGDRRLAEALRQDALSACSSAYDDGR
ncbi:MAG: tetratricopeptide repeat protein [Acidobacteriota bacterium]